MPLHISSILALLGCAIFVVATAQATFLYPNYDFVNAYISDLGIGSTGGLFNTGCIIAGLLVLFFFSSFLKSRTIAGNLLGALGIISMLGLIGVGVFSEDFVLLHIFFTGLFFIFAALTELLFVIIIFAKSRISKLSIFEKMSALLGLIAFVIAFYFLLFAFGGFFEKISVAFSILWLLSLVFLEMKN